MQMKHVASELRNLLAVKLRLDGFHPSTAAPAAKREQKTLGYSVSVAVAKAPEGICPRGDVDETCRRPPQGPAVPSWRSIAFGVCRGHRRAYKRHTQYASSGASG